MATKARAADYKIFAGKISGMLWRAALEKSFSDANIFIYHFYFGHFHSHGRKYGNFSRFFLDSGLACCYNFYLLPSPNLSPSRSTRSVHIGIGKGEEKKPPSIFTSGLCRNLDTVVNI
jgi:hypothetical protein